MQRGLNELIAFIPEFLAALAILLVGYLVAKAIGGLVARVLQRANLDRTLHSGPAGGWIQKATGRPSHLIGRIAFWALFLGAISLAISVLGISALSSFVGEIFAYLPNVLAAVLIFLVAGAIAAGVATLVARTMGDTGLGKIVGTVAPILVMAIAGFMILEQLEIAPEIVRITYAAILGAIALGSALAFGLGGRDVAARMLEGAYEKGQQNKEQFKRDLDRGLSRAKDEGRTVSDEPQPVGRTQAPVDPMSSPRGDAGTRDA